MKERSRLENATVKSDFSELSRSDLYRIYAQSDQRAIRESVSSDQVTDQVSDQVKRLLVWLNARSPTQRYRLTTRGRAFLDKRPSERQLKSR